MQNIQIRCILVVNNKLNWTNPEGHEYPFHLSKPLPLIEDQGRQVVLANYFINNDLEYLKGGSLSRKYTTSTTKTKAAKYDTIEGIEDMVSSLWSPVKVAYDKYAMCGISHWGPKRQSFYGYASNKKSSHDVFSTKRIIAVTHVKVEVTLWAVLFIHIIFFSGQKPYDLDVQWSDGAKKDDRCRRIMDEDVLDSERSYITEPIHTLTSFLRIQGGLAMSSASSAVTYTSVYTDSEPGRPQDPDYVPEPIYPEYIPLEDEHVFPVEEQPLPPSDSPTAESPGYVVESDPEEDPEEYEDDETKDGPVDNPMDGGDDGDDDDGDSSGDDTDDDDEDEDEEDEEEEHEEEQLAPADSVVVVPTVELVSPPEGTEPVTPPPSTDITTTGARITVRLQASISLPPEAEVERLLAMPTLPPSPLILLSPPSAWERLARCTAPSAHSSPPHVSSPLLPLSGCPTKIQTLRIASTQALIDAVIAALPPPVDRKDDLPESELPPRKRLCLSTLGSRYEVVESSTAIPIRGRGIDYGFVSTVDAEARRQGISEVGYGIRDTWVDLAEAVPEISPMTLGEVNTRLTELSELHEHDTQDLYALLEDAQEAHQETIQIVEEEAYASRKAWAYAIGLSQAVHYELQTHREQVYAHESQLHVHQTQLQLQCTLIQTQHQIVETLHVIRDMRREIGDKQAELLALREHQRRARQPGPDVRVPDHQDASKDADSHI
ncbi:hypothetical protein Tco_0140922 [Tanacetum coccineum]